MDCRQNREIHEKIERLKARKVGHSEQDEILISILEWICNQNKRNDDAEELARGEDN